MVHDLGAGSTGFVVEVCGYDYEWSPVEFQDDDENTQTFHATVEEAQRHAEDFLVESGEITGFDGVLCVRVVEVNNAGEADEKKKVRAFWHVGGWPTDPNDDDAFDEDACRVLDAFLAANRPTEANQAPPLNPSLYDEWVRQQAPCPDCGHRQFKHTGDRCHNGCGSMCTPETHTCPCQRVFDVNRARGGMGGEA